MPVPLAPYPTPPTPFTPPANGTQSQLVCSGCRNLLLYPVGATSVCCAVCNAVTAVPPPAYQIGSRILEYVVTSCTCIRLSIIFDVPARARIENGHDSPSPRSTVQTGRPF
uniref:LOL1 (LSD ONE LIKE 1) n=1 Tax=Solanum tuberosum TaxID=4113 RepID=M1BH54_SOLTU